MPPDGIGVGGLNVEFHSLLFVVPAALFESAGVGGGIARRAQRTGVYYEAKLDDTRNEVRLLCRKEDVSLWQRTLSSYSQ